jgi:hypothetical protein
MLSTPINGTPGLAAVARCADAPSGQHNAVLAPRTPKSRREMRGLTMHNSRLAGPDSKLTGRTRIVIAPPSAIRAMNT